MIWNKNLPLYGALICRLRSCLGLVLFLTLGVPAWGHPCVPFTPQTGGPKEIIQEFQVNSQLGTAWRVHWDESIKDRGLVITEAWFKRDLSEGWIQVLADAGLTQVYVPYHPGRPRIKDLTHWSHLNEMTPAEAGPCGALGPLVSPKNGGPPRPVLAKEIRSYGFSYLDKQKPNGSPVVMRKGQALVIWGVYDTGNYDYIMEYGFRDDGTVTFRLGSAGYNNPGHARVAHMHTALWRVDTDISGPAGDTVFVREHKENKLQGAVATDPIRLFKDGKEGHEDFNAKKFTTIQVADFDRRNAYDHLASWEVIPMKKGNARHYDPNPGFPHHKEEFTEHDFWATQNQPGEVWGVWVHKYVKPPQSIVMQDVVLWIQTASHHHPRDEDFRFPDLPGATGVMWSGFSLRPRNLFDASPLLP